MRAIAKLLGACLWLLLILALALALAATFWTGDQLARLAGQRQRDAAAMESRRAYQRVTATALDIQRGGDSMRAGSKIVLMQHRAETPLPNTEPGAEASPAASQTPAPDGIDLPRLLVPPSPDADKWLAGTKVPAPAAQVRRQHQLVNFALLGSDEEVTEDDFIRTDTMILASLNLDTGTVTMLSLPRDLYVYIVHGKMGRLNTAFGLGEYIGWEPGGGFGLLRQTLFYNFGINIHYYARVNFSAFEAIIDLLGGVEIAVDCTYRDYYPYEQEGRDGIEIEYRKRTLPVGVYTFDGFDALWYARIRRLTDDFDRGRRQQQLLRALWRGLRRQGLAATLPRIWHDISSIVDTNIPFDLMLRLLPGVINLDVSTIENLSFDKTHHTREWETPTGSEVLLPNPEAVAALMKDFYTPPAPHQMALAGPAIAVYNSSGNPGWDIVASERLRWGGYNALALGTAEDRGILNQSLLIDNVATEKGSLIPALLKALNMEEEQVLRAPKANRRYDYQVYIGQEYQSCTFGVLPLEE